MDQTRYDLPCNFLQGFSRYIGEDAVYNLTQGMSNDPVILISGGICSGKTTICDAVASGLGFQRLHFGQIYRDWAIQRGIGLEEIPDTLTEEEFEGMDYETSYRVCEEIARAEGGLVLDAHLALCYSHILETLGRKNLIPIHLEVNEKEQIERLMIRGGLTREQARERLSRGARDWERYRGEFGVCFEPPKYPETYDSFLRINTNGKTPRSITAEILREVH